jgi:hypothetical protein
MYKQWFISHFCTQWILEGILTLDSLKVCPCVHAHLLSMHCLSVSLWGGLSNLSLHRIRGNWQMQHARLRYRVTRSRTCSNKWLNWSQSRVCFPPQCQVASLQHSPKMKWAPLTGTWSSEDTVLSRFRKLYTNLSHLRDSPGTVSKLTKC